MVLGSWVVLHSESLRKSLQLLSCVRVRQKVFRFYAPARRQLVDYKSRVAKHDQVLEASQMCTEQAKDAAGVLSLVVGGLAYADSEAAQCDLFLVSCAGEHESAARRPRIAYAGPIEVELHDVVLKVPTAVNEGFVRQVGAVHVFSEVFEDIAILCDN